MRSRRQPKVHRYSKGRRRVTSPGRTILSIGFTFLVAGAVGVLGYSIAKPILQYAGSRQPETSSVESENTEAETTVSVYAEVAETTTTTVSSEMQITGVTGKGVTLSASALESETALQTALEDAREEMPDGTLLVIPLKVQGGALLYQSGVSLAASCGAVQGELTLATIVALAEAQGWTPVAQCSLLYDNLLPDADATAGYQVTSGGRWLDNKKENGGKAWTSPFSQVTQTYLEDLTREMVSAGFAQILYTDAVFPSFRETDLEYIGESVQAADRGEALVQLVNQLAETAGSVPVLLQVDAAGVLDGTEEVFSPDTLTVSGVVLDFGTEAADLGTTLEAVSQTAPELSLWVQAAEITEADSLLGSKQICGYFLNQ